MTFIKEFENRNLLAYLLRDLQPRNRDILLRYFAGEQTRDLAKEYKICGGRVRQIIHDGIAMARRAHSLEQNRTTRFEIEKIKLDLNH